MTAVFKTHLKALVLNKAAAEGESITQTKIQEETGLSLPTIARWYSGELDRIEADAVERLMDYLQCSITDLVTVQSVDEGYKRPTKSPRGRGRPKATQKDKIAS